MRWMSCAVVMLTTGLAASPQTPPPSRPGLPPPGPSQPASAQGRATSQPADATGRIRGRVVTDGGTPVREADVTLSGDLVRQTKSDDSGRFEFTTLPAGRYFLNATKPGMATSLAPVTVRGMPNPSFDLAAAQSLERNVSIVRGGVITGRLVDDFGDPVTGAEIRVERYVHSAAGRQLAQHSGGMPPGWFTDDRGEFRVFALPPGDYLLSARTRQFGAPVTKSARATTDRAEGLLPTYYPGTVAIGDAQALRVAAGAETVAHFAAVAGRLVRVSGTASLSTGRPAVGYHAYLGVETTNSSGSIDGGPVSEDGSFSIGNVPPGNYILRIRPPGLAQPGSEITSMPVAVATQDLTGLTLTTRPGTTIRGRIQWDGTADRPYGQARVSTRSAIASAQVLGGESTLTYLDTESGTVRNDDTFELGGIVGSLLFSVRAPGWSLRSVTLKGRDITDVGVDNADFDTPITIVMTDKVTSLTGTARDAQRRPVRDFVLVLLPQQAMTGNGATRFTRLIRPDGRGTVKTTLPPGDYVGAALSWLDAGDEWDPSVQKLIRSDGHQFTIADGQTLDLELEVLR